MCRSEFFVLTDELPDRKNRENPDNLIGLYVEEASLKKIQSIPYPMEFNLFLEWEYYMFHATHVDYSDRMEQNGKTYVRMKFKEKELMDFSRSYHTILSLTNRLAYYSNHPDLLTPGTWAYDEDQGILYYMPENGIVKAPAYSVTECLIEVNGAKNIRFEHLELDAYCLQPVDI